MLLAMNAYIQGHIAHITRNFHRWCYVHLVVSTFSFLILVCWGIPFCMLGFIGNIIFNPVLALFLCLSTVLFFTEVCLIPNGPIIYALDTLSNLWLYALSLSTNLALEVPCAQPSAVTMGAIACGVIVVMLAQTTYAKKNLYLIAILTGGFMLSQQQVTEICSHDLPCAKESLRIIKQNNKLIIIDPGCLGRYLSAPSFVQYTLIPHIIQKFGTHTIEHLVLLKPGKLTFDAVLMLMQRAKVNHMYIPLWNGTLSKSGLYSFMRLKEKAATCNTELHRLNKSELTLLHDTHGTITLKPLHMQMQKGPIQFNAFCICHTIDKQSVTFYPSQYKQANL